MQNFQKRKKICINNTCLLLMILLKALPNKYKLKQCFSYCRIILMKPVIGNTHII